MRRRWAALTVIAVAVTTAIVGWLYFATPVFDSPERHITRYLAATARGDDYGAMNVWDIYVSSTDPRFHASDQLVQRRRDLTIRLAADHIGIPYTATATEWWATCCTPRTVDGQKNAGLARVHVTATGKDGSPHRLVFEVWVKDLYWAGDAGGEWFHDWRLYDVHDEDQPCLLGGSAYGCVSG